MKTFRVYEAPEYLRIELINEVFLIFITDLVFCYTDHYTPLQQYNSGWLYIFMFTLDFVFIIGYFCYYFLAQKNRICHKIGIIQCVKR